MGKWNKPFRTHIYGEGELSSSLLHEIRKELGILEQQMQFQSLSVGKRERVALDGTRFAAKILNGQASVEIITPDNTPVDQQEQDAPNSFDTTNEDVQKEDLREIADPLSDFSSMEDAREYLEADFPEIDIQELISMDDIGQDESHAVTLGEEAREEMEAQLRGQPEEDEWLLKRGVGYAFRIIRDDGVLITPDLWPVNDWAWLYAYGPGDYEVSPYTGNIGPSQKALGYFHEAVYNEKDEHWYIYFFNEEEENEDKQVTLNPAFILENEGDYGSNKDGLWFPYGGMHRCWPHIIRIEREPGDTIDVEKNVEEHLIPPGKYTVWVNYFWVESNFDLLIDEVYGQKDEEFGEDEDFYCREEPFRCLRYLLHHYDNHRTLKSPSHFLSVGLRDIDYNYYMKALLVSSSVDWWVKTAMHHLDWVNGEPYNMMSPRIQVKAPARHGQAFSEPDPVGNVHYDSDGYPIRFLEEDNCIRVITKYQDRLEPELEFTYPDGVIYTLPFDPVEGFMNVWTGMRSRNVALGSIDDEGNIAPGGSYGQAQENIVVKDLSPDFHEMKLYYWDDTELKDEYHDVEYKGVYVPYDGHFNIEPLPYKEWPQ